MSLELIQKEVSAWPDEMVRRLQGYLVAVQHQRSGKLQSLSAKLDDPNTQRWVSLETVEEMLGLPDESK